MSLSYESSGVRYDLAERSPKTIPKIFRYSTMVEGDSMANTVPTFPVGAS